MKTLSFFNLNSTFVNSLNESIYIVDIQSDYFNTVTYGVKIDGCKTTFLSYSQLFNLINF